MFRFVDSSQGINYLRAFLLNKKCVKFEYFFTERILTFNTMTEKIIPFLRYCADRINFGVNKFNNSPFVQWFFTNGRKYEPFTYKYDGRKLVIKTSTNTYYLIVPLMSFAKWASIDAKYPYHYLELVEDWADSVDTIPDSLMRKYISDNRERWVEAM